MSEPQFIILPIQGQNGQLLQPTDTVTVSGTDQLQEQIAQISLGSDPKATLLTNQSLREFSATTKQRGRKRIKEVSHLEFECKKQQIAEHPSLVKKVISDPSILYSFINWENPARTLASFVTVMLLIISTRYFSPTKWILKILCIVLGATSLLELVGRVATKDGIIARVQPQPYYRPSEYTYARLFSELREAIDMALVNFQKVMFAKDLRVTTIAFALSFIAYWLVIAIPPFWLTVATTILIYTLGPVFTRQLLDPDVPSVRPIIGQKVRGLKDGAVNIALSATNQAANTVQGLNSYAIDAAPSATDHIAGTAQDLSSQAVDAASSATDRIAGTAQGLSSQAVDTASSTTDRVAGTAQDFRNHTTDAVSSSTDHVTGTTQEFKNHTKDTTAKATTQGERKGQDLNTNNVNTAYSGTDRTGAISHEARAHYVSNYTSA